MFSNVPECQRNCANLMKSHILNKPSYKKFSIFWKWEFKSIVNNKQFKQNVIYWKSIIQHRNSASSMRNNVLLYLAYGWNILNDFDSPCKWKCKKCYNCNEISFWMWAINLIVIINKFNQNVLHKKSSKRHWKLTSTNCWYISQDVSSSG